MNALPYLVGIASGILASSVPVVIHLTLIAPAWYLSHDKNREALTAALIGGLVAEFFSPWRFGVLTTLGVGAVVATGFFITRILSIYGTLRLAVSLAVLSTVFSLPAGLLSQNFRTPLASVLLTTLSGFVVMGFYDVRRRRLHT